MLQNENFLYILKLKHNTQGKFLSSNIVSLYLIFSILLINF